MPGRGSGKDPPNREPWWWGGARRPSVDSQGSVRAQGKSPAQVVQRWAWQQNIVLNPRTHNIDYMQENLGIFGADFELTAGEMKEISTGIPIPACERERGP